MIIYLFLLFGIVGNVLGEPLFDYSTYGKETGTYRLKSGEYETKFEPDGTNFESPILALKSKEKTLYNWGRSPYHGTEGVNYDIDDDDRTPYIVCNYYRQGNDSDTLDHKLADDGLTTRCYMDHTRQSQKLGCYAMFDQILNPDNTTSRVLRKQGCHVQRKEDVETYCNQEDCIEHKESDSGPLSSILCCCNTHKCNSELSDKPPIEVELPNGADYFDRLFPVQPKNNHKDEIRDIDIWGYIYAILIAFAAVVFILIAIVGLYLNQVFRITKRPYVRDTEQGVPLIAHSYPSELPIESMLVEEEEFELAEIEFLSKGSMSSVFTAMLTNEDKTKTKVAVKIFPKDKKSDCARELRIYHHFMKLNECNSILRFIGATEYNKREYRIITEYHLMGNLRSYLHETTLSIANAFSVMCSALEGLSYIHEERIIDSRVIDGIAHKDIKTSNILLKRKEDNSLQAILADFGFAEKLEPDTLNKTPHKQLGTFRYMAPEVLSGTQSFSAFAFKAPDVYSMSLVIWELLSRTDIPGAETPIYLAAMEAEVPEYSKNKMKIAVHENRKRPMFRTEIIEHSQLRQVASTCNEMWHFEAEARVTSSFAYERISRIQEEYLANEVAKPAVAATATKKNRSGEFYENVIVHFDLKGAPPKVPYFLELLRLVHKSGATGILLEWEEMFPWSGELEQFRGTDAYSLQDVKTILNEIRTLGMDIIPLVQTFGHLEWILKYEKYVKYRENEAYPQVLCLGDEDGVNIVKTALRQVIEVHKEYGIPYFHIGADEAFEFGVCEKSRDWINKNGGTGGKQLLALTHLKKIAQFTKSLTGEETTILAWHDMLKDFDGRVIKSLDMGQLIEPVIWDYSENIVTMNDWAFSNIADNFPVVWASSAYKGANFPSAMYIDIRHYETNNRAWITTKNDQQKKYKKFHGIIITGWSRYDHLARLCEILPVGTPSMVLQIKTALAGTLTNQEDVRKKAAEALGCSSYSVAGLNLVSNQCTFPGFRVYAAFQGSAQQSVADVEAELGKNHHVMGWLSPYAVRHNISQNWYLSQIDSFLSGLLNTMERAENNIRNEMKDLFFPNTIDEFLYETIGPTTDKLRRMRHDARELAKLRTYPKRHFEIKREL